jgi:predicted RND superfamily exporter protein
MVLILSRYRDEKARGQHPREAMITAVSRIGRAIVASALTTLAGFAVLMASNFVMLRDFGIATVIGIILCIISTMMVMPPLIVWLDERRGKNQTSTNTTT